ncbi:hypothetical protein ACFFHC_02710 [Kytococcus schroeteri]
MAFPIAGPEATAPSPGEASARRGRTENACRAQPPRRRVASPPTHCPTPLPGRTCLLVISLLIGVICTVACYRAGRQMARVGAGLADEDDRDLGMPIITMWLCFGFLYLWHDFEDPVQWGLFVVVSSTTVGWIWTRAVARGAGLIP